MEILKILVEQSNNRDNKIKFVYNIYEIIYGASILFLRF